RPVMLAEVLRVLAPRPGEVAVDATVGWAGHARELLQRVGPQGRLIGFDLDADNLARAREPLAALGLPFVLRHGNFASLPAALAGEGLDGADVLVADLGMSSMQVDDARRGFSYVRDGPLDMRMDRSRGKTAAQVLATIPEGELARALRELGDESEADKVARLIVAARHQKPLERTGDLANLLLKGGPWRLHPSPGRWNLHPAARTFQALRILVNRELANLHELLRVLPSCLAPGGKAVIISFHSGEDRRVKTAFRAGHRNGIYSNISQGPLLASWEERANNPR